MSELKQAELPLSVSNEPQKDFKKIELPGFAEVENLYPILKREFLHWLLYRSRKDI